MPTEFPTATRLTSAVIGEITDQLESFSEMNTVGSRPLTSTAGSSTVALSRSFDFKVGYAYLISWQGRVQLNGLSATLPGAVEFALKRNNASGTVIINPGFTAIPPLVAGSSQFSRVACWAVVKVTVADTTQTVALCAQFANINGATSLDIEAGSTAPTTLLCQAIGLASDHPQAIELPTA